MEKSPFDTIESAEEFLQLLHQEIGKSEAQITELIRSSDSQSDRRREALLVVLHKLDQLGKNTDSSQRLLRDLRSLRTLLLKEQNKI